MLSDKFVRKYMRMAKQLGEDENPCYSRQIGVVLVDPVLNKVLGTGYNGPPQKSPHCDTREYLSQIVWPQLNDNEKRNAMERFGLSMAESGPWQCERLREGIDKENEQAFLNKAAGCKICPRRLIGAPTGERTELCSCEHAERNAIYNAACNLSGAWAFCWCGMACWDCTKAIIRNRIERCYFIADGSYARNGGQDYSFGSRWLMDQAGVKYIMEPPDFYLNGE